MTYREQLLGPDRSILIVAHSGQVSGLDRTTGVTRWQNEMLGDVVDEVFIAVNFGAVIASSSANLLFCLDYLTGVERWRAVTSATGRATIVIEEDEIVCAKPGAIDCFDPSGRRLWSKPLNCYEGRRVALGFPGNVAQADESGRK